MAGILFVGLVAYPLLPVAPLPQVDFPTIQVSASLPGASPETMASSVAQPLERQFAQIPGVAQMTSTSSLGSTAITIQFDLNRNIDARRQRRPGGDQCRRADSCRRTCQSPPTYRKVNPADSPILHPVGDIGHAAADRGRATRSRPSSRSRSARFPASPRSSSAASRSRRSASRSIRRSSSPRACRSRTSAAQIAITTVDSPKGNIDGPTRAYTIYANDQLLDAEGLERRHHRLSQRRRRCGSATSARRSPGRRT